mmetsp:Transcript_23523/g.53989  ORF Transcript_23523/g.53989 Transcript_23523/m.53989 type:complete len:317 (+) Transcript_23523:427-1377(+)
MSSEKDQSNQDEPLDPAPVDETAIRGRRKTRGVRNAMLLALAVAVILAVGLALGMVRAGRPADHRQRRRRRKRTRERKRKRRRRGRRRPPCRAVGVRRPRAQHVHQAADPPRPRTRSRRARGTGPVRLGQPEPADTRPSGLPRPVRRPPVPGTGSDGGRRPPLAGGPVEPVRGARVPRPELERSDRVGPVGTPRRAAGVVRAVPRPVVEQPRGRGQPRHRRPRGHLSAGRHEAPGRQGGGQRDRPAGCAVPPRVGPSQLDLPGIRPRGEPLRDQGRVDGRPTPSLGHRLRHVESPGHDRVEPHPEIPLGDHPVRAR